MPKTSSQRSKEYRERNKGKANYKKQNAERQKKYRQNLTETEKAVYAEKSYERCKLTRKRKADAALNDSVGNDSQPEISTPTPSPAISFRTKQSKGKALKKASAALPLDPDQRKEVIISLAKQYDEVVVSKKRGEPKAQPEIYKKVVEFYRRDDISRCKPGRKDVVNRMRDGQKVPVAKRYLCLTIGEAHSLFLEENPGSKVGRSKFFQLRPDDVFLIETNDQEVCVCPICENFDFMSEAASLGNYKQLVEQLLCGHPTNLCKSNNCKTCPISKPGFIAPFLPKDKPTFFLKRWEKGILVTDTVELNDFQKQLEAEIKQFIEHMFLKNRQAEAIREQKENLQPGEVLIQTENYAIKYHREVMESHWKNLPGVVILTAVAYHKCEGELRAESFAVCSDVGQNTTLEMVFLLEAILVSINNSGISFQKGVKIWTDGCSKHFKNRYAMCFLTRFEDLYGPRAEWHFNESYHGKGSMDGIGAVVKHNVFKAVLRKGALVLNAKDFASTAKEICKKTTVLYRSAEELEEKEVEYKRLWEGASPCTGILGARCVKVRGPYKVALYKISLDQLPFAIRDMTPKATPPVATNDAAPTGSIDNPAPALTPDTVETSTPTAAGTPDPAEPSTPAAAATPDPVETSTPAAATPVF